MAKVERQTWSLRCESTALMMMAACNALKDLTTYGSRSSSTNSRDTGGRTTSSSTSSILAQ